MRKLRRRMDWAQMQIRSRIQPVYFHSATVCIFYPLVLWNDKKMVNSKSDPRIESGPDDREAILEMLKETMDGLRDDIERAEPETLEEQRLQLRQRHELGYLGNQYRKLQRDMEIDEMDQRMVLLEDEGEGEGEY